MSRFQISAEAYEAIKAAEKGCKDKKTSKRLRILMLRYEGCKVADIAKMYGTRKESTNQRAAGAGRKSVRLFPAITFVSIGMLMAQLSQ